MIFILGMIFGYWFLGMVLGIILLVKEFKECDPKWYIKHYGKKQYILMCILSPFKCLLFSVTYPYIFMKEIW